MGSFLLMSSPQTARKALVKPTIPKRINLADDDSMREPRINRYRMGKPELPPTQEKPDGLFL
jgi:hypothetical protein